MKVLVVGAGGWIGSRIVEALEQVEGVELLRGSRSGQGDGWVKVDLTKPDTFSGLTVDVVVNASDTLLAPPDALARYCLKNGILFVETSAERLALERMLAWREEEGISSAAGGVVLGTGIFPGLSNLLATHMSQSLEKVEHLRIGISTSPFSESGQGTVDLMVHFLQIQATSVEDGKLCFHPPVSAGPLIPFWSQSRRCLRAPLAEPALLHASSEIPQIHSFFSPTPFFLPWAYLALPRFLMKQRWFQGFMRVYLSFVRRVALRWRKSPTQITVIANPEQENKIHQIYFRDGILAAGYVVAALLEELQQSGRNLQGVLVLDEVFEWEDVLARVKRLSGDAIGFQSRET